MGLPSNGSPEGKIVVFNEKCPKNKITLKNNDFFPKFIKIGSSVFKVTPRGLHSEGKIVVFDKKKCDKN